MHFALFFLMLILCAMNSGYATIGDYPRQMESVKDRTDQIVKDYINLKPAYNVKLIS